MTSVIAMLYRPIGDRVGRRANWRARPGEVQARDGRRFRAGPMTVLGVLFVTSASLFAGGWVLAQMFM